MTTHQNFASAAAHQAKMLRIQPGTRVFDFVSYCFDVSWSNTLQTLICGGCLCIPAEWERRNDISGAFNRMSCYSYFTPSVARSLEPSDLPGLQTLAMGGEPIPTTEIARWTQVEAIIGIYGPAECAQALTFTLLQPDGRTNYCGILVWGPDVAGATRLSRSPCRDWHCGRASYRGSHSQSRVSE